MLQNIDDLQIKGADFLIGKVLKLFEDQRESPEVDIDRRIFAQRHFLSVVLIFLHLFYSCSYRSCFALSGLHRFLSHTGRTKRTAIGDCRLQAARNANPSGATLNITRITRQGRRINFLFLHRLIYLSTHEKTLRISGISIAAKNANKNPLPKFKIKINTARTTLSTNRMRHFFQYPFCIGRGVIIPLAQEGGGLALDVWKGMRTPQRASSAGTPRPWLKPRCFQKSHYAFGSLTFTQAASLSNNVSE